MLFNIVKAMQYKNPYVEQCLEGSCSMLKGLTIKEKEVLEIGRAHV